MLNDRCCFSSILMLSSEPKIKKKMCERKFSENCSQNSYTILHSTNSKKIKDNDSQLSTKGEIGGKVHQSSSNATKRNLFKLRK